MEQHHQSLVRLLHTPVVGVAAHEILLVLAGLEVVALEV
jgi:hypothetical protein